MDNEPPAPPTPSQNPPVDETPTANPLIPKSAVKTVNDISQKLTSSAAGVDDVADNLEKMMDQGLNTVEKKLTSWMDGLDKLLGGK